LLVGRQPRSEQRIEQRRLDLATSSAARPFTELSGEGRQRYGTRIPPGFVREVGDVRLVVGLLEGAQRAVEVRGDGPCQRLVLALQRPDVVARRRVEELLLSLGRCDFGPQAYQRRVEVGDRGALHLKPQGELDPVHRHALAMAPGPQKNSRVLITPELTSS